MLTISYRLSAEPDKGGLTIAQDVAPGQFSGFTWDKVDTCVSTLRRDRTLRPFPLNSWRISLEPKVKPVARMRQEEKLVGLAGYYSQSAVNQLPMAAPPSQDVAQPVPYQEERSTFRKWSLGRQRTEHKTPMRLSLATDSIRPVIIIRCVPSQIPRVS